jgi:hypothetical protein
MPFGNAIRPVRELIEYLMTGLRPVMLQEKLLNGLRSAVMQDRLLTA